MANGSYSGHRALEREFADFYHCHSCIVFTTGYQANLATISGLAGVGDVVLIDGDSHASIYDGCRLSGAEIIRFRHNDMVDLEKASPASRKPLTLHVNHCRRHLQHAG